MFVEDKILRSQKGFLTSSREQDKNGLEIKMKIRTSNFEAYVCLSVILSVCIGVSFSSFFLNFVPSYYFLQQLHSVLSCCEGIQIFKPLPMNGENSLALAEKKLFLANTKLTTKKTLQLFSSVAIKHNI